MMMERVDSIRRRGYDEIENEMQRISKK